MKRISLLLTFALVITFLPARADSPLTSTPFWQAYNDLPEVIHASKLLGRIDKKTIDFILNEEVGVDSRMAAINALSWNVGGQNNAEALLQAIRSRFKVKSPDELNGDDAASLLALYAYMKSMDNYFDVKEALSIASKALLLEPANFTINMIRSLILAQDVMDHDFCKVYTSMNHLKELERGDFRDEAMKIIFDYIDIYRGAC
jgi:hypothetical protein